MNPQMGLAMPELPEVECVRQMLEPMIVSRTVVGVVVRRRDMVVTPDDPPGGFARSGTLATQARPVHPSELLVGGTITAVLRHGKALAFTSNAGPAVVIHLGMTGSVHPLDGEPGTHTHLIWTFADGVPLAFTDPRRFGGVWCLQSSEALQHRWEALGPDALGVRAAQLRDRLQASARPIKVALLDQHAVAGIGNIYADEALFRAGIDPHSRCDQLNASDWSPLASAIRQVLREGIQAGGASIRDYRRPDGTSGGQQRRLRVYGRLGQPCTKCGSQLAGSRLGGRATVWCPSCQTSR